MHSPSDTWKGLPRGTPAQCDMDGLLQWFYAHTCTILTGEGKGGTLRTISRLPSMHSPHCCCPRGFFTKTVPRVDRINSESPCIYLVFLVSTSSQVGRAIAASHIWIKEEVGAGISFFSLQLFFLISWSLS